MMIREETQADIEAITEITKQAFENHPFSRNTEQFIIHALRTANALTVSLVAENDGTVVGHIAFSPVTFTDGSENWYGLEHEGVGQENFLALPFGGQIPQGIVEFHPAFGATE